MKLNERQLTFLQYNDPAYLEAIRYIAEDRRVAALGLCNFDTEHMEKVLQQGVKIHSNQVQVSGKTGIVSRIVHDQSRVCLLTAQ